MATTAVPTLVTNAGRNVTVQGAGLNGTSVQCVINSATTVTGKETITSLLGYRLINPKQDTISNRSFQRSLGRRDIFSGRW